MSECIQISFAVCRIGIYTCFRALCCKGPPPARPEYDLVCIGLTGSGKTSLLSKLCSESPNSVVSTTGFSIKAVPFQNAILNVKELGGADNIRKYWSRYYQGSQGVIFVLDSASSEDDLETARNELHSALQHPQLCTLPFLILANHQDKPAARSVQEVCLIKATALCLSCLLTFAAMLESEKIPVVGDMLVILFCNMRPKFFRKQKAYINLIKIIIHTHNPTWRP
ncbi:ADP-ribosylation factor-like protein 15 isoform X1 [Delphinapterus leucas]|uniref:ADP-ribosylation factor-like protein 15 n=2 Tax=Monodontidae TaxID=9747 RepID=A0A2Y9Q700_DELLE|nr:ADP-ribosylation factor-like protein 15 isoform X1 [Delphinapterus leucas]